MAGHSKWANIQHRKGAQDKKRGKLFTKFIREITTAARMGGDDPDANPRLRQAIDKALAGNMTRDTIDRAVKKGAGKLEGAAMVEKRFEGYGPCGVAVLVDCLTDNNNRTVSEVRHAFSKAGGNLGTDGSVAYLFNKRGIISFDEGDVDKIMEIALEAEADDVMEERGIDVITAPDKFLSVKDALVAAGFESKNADVQMDADQKAELSNVEDAQKVLRFIDVLEDLDDVQNVYTNADISDEIAEQL